MISWNLGSESEKPVECEAILNDLTNVNILRLINCQNNDKLKSLFTKLHIV